MKEIYIFTIFFAIINISIYYYFEDMSCIDNNNKFYIILFYVLSLIYLINLYLNNTRDNFTPSVIDTPIIIDLSSNPEYSLNSVKLIYWGIDYNINGIVDIVDGKVQLPVNHPTSLKYRIIDINEKLSNIYDVI
jgi:ferredoxin-fold anticodon binding domain-containing protein